MAPSSTRTRSRTSRRSVSVEDVGTDIATDSTRLPLPVGERGGVRGFGSTLIEHARNLLQHVLDVPHHVVIPEPDDKIAERFEGSRSLGLSYSAGMLTTVQF